MSGILKKKRTYYWDLQGICIVLACSWIHIKEEPEPSLIFMFQILLISFTVLC